MPTGRLSMRRIRDVLRLKYAQGMSDRAISASLGLGKGTVGAYLGRARARVAPITAWIHRGGRSHHVPDRICLHIHYGFTASADKAMRAVRMLRITDLQGDCVNWGTVPAWVIDSAANGLIEGGLGSPAPAMKKSA